MSSEWTLDDFLSDFPFNEIRPQQRQVLQEICDALNEGYRYVLLQAPTGFGKSPVAICLAKAFGSSYICTATKNLQSQYTNDFPFLRSVKGMSGFSCNVREDYILNNSYACDKCKINQTKELIPITSIQECGHKSVSFGPCRDDQFGYDHDTKNCEKCADIKAGVLRRPFIGDFHEGCRYRPFREDYEIVNANTNHEEIVLKPSRAESYLKHSNRMDWVHMTNVANPAVFKVRTEEFTPCAYYDQLNKGVVASHTIFNYANFLIFQRLQKSNILREKRLLVLDEGHLIEQETINFVGLAIQRWQLQKYLEFDYKDFVALTYFGLNYNSSIRYDLIPFLKKVYGELYRSINLKLKKEIKIEAKEFLDKLEFAIYEIESNPDNWIISNIERDDNHDQRSKIKSISFKPIDISQYCKPMFSQCETMLIMSATILDAEAFCKSIGLDRKQVKFIQTESDFPIENRPVYNLNITKLNYRTMQLESTQREIARTIDIIMNAHKNEKGIIHVTSYSQLSFIRKYISKENDKRLIATIPEYVNGEEALAQQKATNKPTVLISPALQLGIDLKDDLSRFQILVKVPYGDLNDRWINAKKNKDQEWYNWKTALSFVQACGRSVRSKDDYAVTYLLDSKFDSFIFDYNGKLPKWFKDAISSKNIVTIVKSKNKKGEMTT